MGVEGPKAKGKSVILRGYMQPRTVVTCILLLLGHIS